MLILVIALLSTVAVVDNESLEQQLWEASKRGGVEMIGELIEAGAELDVADNFYSNTPIGMAGWLRYGDCVRVPIEKGSTGGIGAMFAAVSNGHADAVAAVLESMEVTEGVIENACTQVAQAGAREVVDVLVAFGATEPELPEPSGV